MPTGLQQVILALITSNLSRTGMTRVPVLRESPAGTRMGLMVDSVIVCDVVQTVHHDAVQRTIGTCPVMSEVDRALCATLRLP